MLQITALGWGEHANFAPAPCLLDMQVSPFAQKRPLEQESDESGVPVLACATAASARTTIMLVMRNIFVNRASHGHQEHLSATVFAGKKNEVVTDGGSESPQTNHAAQLALRRMPVLHHRDSWDDSTLSHYTQQMPSPRDFKLKLCSASSA